MCIGADWDRALACQEIQELSVEDVRRLILHPVAGAIDDDDFAARVDAAEELSEQRQPLLGDGVLAAVNGVDRHAQVGKELGNVGRLRDGATVDARAAGVVGLHVDGEIVDLAGIVEHQGGQVAAMHVKNRLAVTEMTPSVQRDVLRAGNAIAAGADEHEPLDTLRPQHRHLNSDDASKGEADHAHGRVVAEDRVDAFPDKRRHPHRGDVAVGEVGVAEGGHVDRVDGVRLGKRVDIADPVAP